MSWHAEIDARLVARLLRAGEPGLIGMCLARRIMGTVEQMAGRLPLLARFPRVTERSRAGETAIVHALPLAASRAERSDHGPPGERVLRVVTARTVERERVLERSIVELAAVPPQRAAMPRHGAAMPSRSQGAESPSRIDAMRPSAEPAARRSRMGAPLATSTLPPVMPVAAPVQRSLANAPLAAPSTLPPVVPVVAPPAVLGSRRPAGSSTETPLAIVAPRRSPSSVSGPAVVRPVLRSVEIDAASGPIVAPRRSLAPRAEPSLAHVAPAPAPAAASAAPKPDAAPPVAPRVLASPALTPLRTKDAASPISQPLQRADLPEIAARVQRIMERQALHDRARRGLRR